MLSEELLEQAAQMRASAERSSAPDAAAQVETTPAGALNWNLLIRLTAVVAGSLTLLSLVLAPFALLVWLWAPIAPAIVLALYAARERGARLDFRCGARIGLVCGLLIIAGQAIVETVVSDVMRFGLKHTTDVDAEMNNALTPLRTQLAAQYGAQSAMVGKLGVPEFRAGLVLAGFGTLAIVIVGLACTGGAVAGHLRGRTQTA